MSPLAEQLTGEIPGLLRRGSPVTCTSDCDGVVALVYTDGAIAVAISDREIEPSSPDICTLDTSDPTGRFHCREWLANRGHDVGNEDRAEVLAWSVLSVWRGGKPLQVLPAWEKQPSFGMDYYVRESSDGCMVGRAHYQHWWVGQAPKFQGITALLHGEGYTDSQWTATGIADWEHDDDWKCGQRACDARLLALGWALTNADGTLTLPPLPEVA